jgi:hypothetical protein
VLYGRAAAHAAVETLLQLGLECRNYNESIVQMSGKPSSKLRIDAAIRAAHHLGPVYTRDASAMAMGGAMVSTNSLRVRGRAHA